MVAGIRAGDFIAYIAGGRRRFRPNIGRGKTEKERKSDEGEGNGGYFERERPPARKL